MELFSEVYSKYYHIINEILIEAHNKPITTQSIYSILQQQGFRDTTLNLAPKLINNDDKDSYNLLIKSNDNYQSILNLQPSLLLTNLEVRWMKSLLYDKRIALFFDEKELTMLREQLSYVNKLYNDESFQIIGQDNDGDPYEDIDYIINFKTVLNGVNNRKCLYITYLTSEGNKRQAVYAPYRLEYSAKDDKFRLNAVQVSRGKLRFYSKINIARIIHVEIIEEAIYPDNLSEFIYSHKIKEPIEIIVNNYRNGFERCFIHLSNYERKAEYNEETNTCRIKIYYYDFDEAELVIKLLSYGPIVRVVGPESFKNKIVERINKQKQLFSNLLDYKEEY